jgi:hypothetical protein
MNPSGQKFKNTITEQDGIKFHSKLEANCYTVLKNSSFKFTMQDSYTIQESFKDGKKTIRAITYKSDFVVNHNGHEYVYDSKGFETPDYKIKKKLLLAKGIRIIQIKTPKRMQEAIDLMTAGTEPRELQAIVEAKRPKTKKKIEQALSSLSS